MHGMFEFEFIVGTKATFDDGMFWFAYQARVLPGGRFTETVPMFVNVHY